MSCHQTVLTFLLISTISKAAGDCGIPFDGSNDISLVKPHGQTKVAQGHVLQYICQSGYVLTEGSLTLGCTSANKLNGTMPACNRPEFLTGDSNDVELRNREHTIEEYFAYTGVGTRLAIERKGVIKQWKFYSRQKGFVFFQVWRPLHRRGEYRFILVGQNQVETLGQGNETYDLDAADWIVVQPGDRIGLSEPKEYRGFVPYSTCSKDKHPEDFNVTKAFASRGDFSYSCLHTFSSDPECMEFSFKAVIHPPMSLPDKPDLPTSSVALVSGYDMDARKTVFLGDSSNFYIPVDGCVKEWQFYAIHGGSGAFQVWRREGAIGEWRYKLIGQNFVERHYDDEGLLKLKVKEKERIAVKAGDIIGFLYGHRPMGIPYSMCDAQVYPDSTNVSSFRRSADPIVTDHVYDFKPVSSPCRVLRFRAIVKQACDRPDDLHTSDVDLVSRPYRGYTTTAYVGNSTNFYIPADGYVKEWQFFSKHGGTGAFQVWRGTQNKLRYELIGQNDINWTSQVAAPYRFSVKEAERIYVKKGDSIGFLFGGEMTGIPYSRCHSQREKDMNNNASWLYPVIPEEMLVGQLYNFSLGSDKSLFCRVFSLKAVIEQASDRPDDVYTADVAIINRDHGGYYTTTYLGDSSNFYIPANGSVKEWQFFSNHPGHGAFQVWRRVDAAAKKYKLIGQNTVNLTSGRVGRHRLRVEEAERIAVRKGDIIGVHYGAKGSTLGLPYSFCSGEEKETNKNVYWFWPAMPDDMEVGRPYSFTVSGGQYFCRVFSVRAVIEQEPHGTS